MFGLNDYHHALRIECLLNAVLDLHCHTFLHLKAVAEDVYNSGYLGEARNLPVGNVGHVGLSIEGKHVVFAEGVEVYVLDDNHLVVVLVELGGIEHGHGVHRVSASEGEHGLGHALGRLEQALALSILAQQLENAVVLLLEFFDGFRVVCLHRKRVYLAYIIQAPGFATLREKDAKLGDWSVKNQI